jgi:hypothetical protein
MRVGHGGEPEHAVRPVATTSCAVREERVELTGAPERRPPGSAERTKLDGK